jgi:hypothetical protein
VASAQHLNAGSPQIRNPTKPIAFGLMIQVKVKVGFQRKELKVKIEEYSAGVG